jgi:RND family efflux transporter MFP subunit
MYTRRKSMTLFLCAIAVCVFTAIWLVAIAQPSRDEAATSDDGASASTLTVRSAIVRSKPWPNSIEAFGNIAPWEEMIVSAQVEGQPLVELRANVGDQVRSGQVLARFSTEMLRAESRRLRADVEQAKAEVGQANSERDRALQLADSGAISKLEITRRVTAAQVAVARLSAVQAQLSARELDLERASVVAPDDGTISARNALPGMIGTPGLELFRIIRRDRLEWRGELTGTQLSRVVPGQQVMLTLPDGATAHARIRQLAPMMNMQTRLATVYADIEPGSLARAGTFVSGRIVFGESPALIVPASSVVVRDGQNFAFKVAAKGQHQQVEQQRVEVGRRMSTEVEILSGLRQGEHVVAQGAGFLEDGDGVRVAGTSR